MVYLAIRYKIKPAYLIIIFVKLLQTTRLLRPYLQVYNLCKTVRDFSSKLTTTVFDQIVPSSLCHIHNLKVFLGFFCPIRINAFLKSDTGCYLVQILYYMTC